MKTIARSHLKQFLCLLLLAIVTAPLSGCIWGVDEDEGYHDGDHGGYRHDRDRDRERYQERDRERERGGDRDREWHDERR